MSATSSRSFTSLLGSLGPLLALVAVFALFAGLEMAVLRYNDSPRPPVFLSADNLHKIVAASAVTGICALGMTVVIISGGIDLSVGTGIALCATVLACALIRDVHPVIAITLTLLTGCVLGAVNGITISGLRVVPFIVTLGTMTAYLGAGKLLADNVAHGALTVRPKVIDVDAPNYAGNQVPEWLKVFTSTREKALWPGDKWAAENLRPALQWIRFPSGVWLGFALALLVAAVLRYTVFGRHVFALGSNEATARLCGVNVTRVRILVYTLAGLFVGIAGIYQFSRLSVGNPTSGSGIELQVIAAVVIGGGSLSGGRGSVMGTLAGAGMMSVITSGCTQLGVSNALQDVVVGVIIVAAVTLDQLRQRRFAAA